MKVLTRRKRDRQGKEEKGGVKIKKNQASCESKALKPRERPKGGGHRGNDNGGESRWTRKVLAILRKVLYLKKPKKQRSRMQSQLRGGTGNIKGMNRDA